ncbi:MAG: type II toxin-antitoxin system HicA family toxin [Chloroflexota bacterium]|nr:type II toxin-antitoxin system HicA family toxin [Chloroflexota bacterium]MDE2884863.1 type II toxin-antitoxin system HicA family toxin [Chloroflexota bacterium]
MPRLGAISRRELITALRRAGFAGPRSGARHEFMKRGGTRVPLPNPHRGDISRALLVTILREAGIGRDEWEAL